MLQDFLRHINQSNNNTVTAHEVESLLNEAVYDYANRILMQATPLPAAGTGYEDSLWSMNMLAPLKKEETAQPDGTGYIPAPEDWMYWVAVLAQGPNACEEDSDWRDIGMVRENELGAIYGNYFTRPRYNDQSVNPMLQTKMYARFVDKDGQPGLQIIPYPTASKVIRYVYIRKPRPIQIKTPQRDLQYRGVANFVERANDVNCELPALSHPTVVRIAVQKFDQAVGNIEALSTSVQQEQRGVT